MVQVQLLWNLLRIQDMKCLGFKIVDDVNSTWNSSNGHGSGLWARPHEVVKLGFLMLWDIFLVQWRSHLQVSRTFLSTCHPRTTNCGYKHTGKYTWFKLIVPRSTITAKKDLYSGSVLYITSTLISLLFLNVKFKMSILRLYLFLS